MILPLLLASQLASLSVPNAFVTTVTNTPRDVAWPDPLLPAGIQFRYRASDLSASPVSVWTDSVSGYSWVQSTGANQPSWSANGVDFDGSNDILTATNGVIDTDAGAVLIIFRNDNTASAGHMILCNSWSANNILVGIGDTANFFYDPNVGNNALGPVGTNLKDFLTTKLSADSKYYAYTNGVASQFAAKNSPWADGVNLTRVGSGNGNAFFDGAIQEVVIWTNQVAWTSGQVSNVHYYATNTYGYSP